ncbi:MAG TPA: DoxX family membrane protein [Acidimicrobiales bacterium]|nr:DoxX family membrane protein [Acidimicrobiales bacterium]
MTRASEQLAGALLAPMFISGGWDAFRNPESKVKAAEAVTGVLSSRFSFVPDDPAVLIRLNGAAQVGAGALLATGHVRRVAAMVLIGSLVPTTYAGHRFWTEADEDRRAQQQIHLLKNAAMLGGLVLMAGPRRRVRVKKR